MPFRTSIRRWVRNRFGPLRWDERLISDAWFRTHFEGAARVVVEWLGSELDLRRAHVVDFGCGDGITSLGVMLHGRPERLVGVDIHDAFTHLEVQAQQQLGLDALPSSLGFRQVERGSALPPHGVDAIYSWSVFEHLDRADLPEIVGGFFEMLRPGGLVFVQIDPLYFSAFGSHLARVVPEPWAHLLLDAQTLEERVQAFHGELEDEDRDLAASEGVTPKFKAWLLQEYQALNRLTGDELVESFRAAGFEIVREHRRQGLEEPPAELLADHDELVLKTREIRLLARKPA